MPKKQVPYINRDIAWLSFNERVLQEANDPSTPLIERIKFLAIYSNNRDEFYRVRVATVKRMLKLGKRAVPLIGIEPGILLDSILKKVLEQQNKFEIIYQAILKELEKNKINIINEKQLNKEQQLYVKDYFQSNVVSNLFPILIDFQDPFPYLKDKSSYLYVKLIAAHTHTHKNKYAVIEVPTKSLSRFVVLPKQNDKDFIILLDDVIRFCLDEIFEVFGYKAVEAYNIKLTRDAELELDNDLSQSLLEKVSEGVKHRKKGNPVRLVYDRALSKDMLLFMMRKLNFSKKDAPIAGGRYHNFKDFIKFPTLGKKNLIYSHNRPLNHKYLFNPKISIISTVLEKDILLHYPYHTFDKIIALLREAALEPTVESIKITLYRVADSSKIANALINAIKNGKQVTVVVELQARFDEENNIYWANKLTEEGARVIYGVPRLKVHSKLFLITMRKKGKEVKIAHIGTGNFNENTAKIYTDFSLLTADKRITDEVEQVFTFFNDNFRIGNFKYLMVSPFNMRKSIFGLINREISNAKEGKNAYIIIKVNNLVDFETVTKLYEASQAGVKINLIIRGSCALVCGVPGYSENIEGISIVDKYLEHTRVFVFGNNGNERYFISSADWMTRNLDQRCEVAVPIFDKEIQKQLKDMLTIQLSSNVKTRILDKNLINQYVVPKLRSKKIRAQDAVYDYILQDKLSYLKQNKLK